MLVRWNERPTPMRTIRCGAAPVMSRPSSLTVPVSGCRCPVMRLNSVDLPAPFGPMTAAICRVSTDRLTSDTARKPPKDLLTPAISSTRPTSHPRPERVDAADNPPGKHEQQDQEDRAQHERPILRVVGDFLVEPNQGQRADRRSPEEIHAAEDRHDHDLGRFGPEDKVGEDAAAENPVQRTGEPGKGAGHD